jgi:hypothetical protein
MVFQDNLPPLHDTDLFSGEADTTNNPVKVASPPEMSLFTTPLPRTTLLKEPRLLPAAQDSNLPVMQHIRITPGTHFNRRRNGKHIDT